MDAATESICPKGWTLPSKIQIDNITGGTSGSTAYIGVFLPTLGGFYDNGISDGENIYSGWWTTETNSSRIYRYNLAYNASLSPTALVTNNNRRYYGFYIRCVSEEKDVSDLTYMQDMTPSIATNTAEGATASLTDRRDGKVYTVAKINGNMWMTQNLRLGYNSSNPDTYTIDLTEQDSNITFTTAERNAGKRTLQLYDLVSRGKNTSGSNQCNGTYDSGTGTGTSGGYINACIHSGTIANIDTNTVWYNYVTASAGTITGTNNTATATQSICPKGWMLPNGTQTRSIGPNGPSNPSPTYVSMFSPVLGGYYGNSTLNNESTRGAYWGSEALSTDNRAHQDLVYIDGGLYTGGYIRSIGLYIRCVSSS